MSALPRQTPGFHLHSMSVPTSETLLRQHAQLVYEEASITLDVYKPAHLPSVTIDFTFEGQRYKGIAYPVEDTKENK